MVKILVLLSAFLASLGFLLNSEFKDNEESVNGVGGIIEVADKEVYGKLYTDTEYAKLKSDIAIVIKNRKSKLPSPDEGEIFKQLVSQKLRECGGGVLKDITEKNIFDKLSDYIAKAGC